MVRLVEPDVMLCIDYKVTSVNVVSFNYLFKDFWLVNSSLLHKVNDFILHNNGVINIVIHLNL